MIRIAAFLIAVTATPGLAFDRVISRDAFVAMVAGRDLVALGVRLVVRADGGLTGRAFGRAVTGSWTWEDGYFCRTITAGSRVLPRNCQTVARDGDTLRFTADRGAGDTADLRLR